MKRIIAILLSAVMLTGAFCVVSNASGALLFRDNFDNGVLPNNWLRGEFFHAELDDGNGVCAGYHNAVVLQSNYLHAADPKMWDTFYACIDINVRDGDYPDMSNSDKYANDAKIGMWYRDCFEPGYTDPNASIDKAGPTYYYFINVMTGEAVLQKDGHEFIYEDEEGHLKTGVIHGCELARVKLDRVFRLGEWEEEEWFNIGMRVSQGRIECYLDGVCIIDCKADPEGEHIGPWAVKGVDETVGTYKSAILLINDYLYLYMDNFEVWEPSYADDFQGFVYGDANGDGIVDETDIVAMLRVIAGWDTEDMENGFDADCSDVDLDGEVTLRDAVLVMQHLAGWRVTLGQEQ